MSSDSQPAEPTKQRIVILGGGCAGVVAAFWLTATEALRQRFEITLYTRGWRLGGKGASGRNRDQSDRIEEHGLHMWFGSYDNAFRTLRTCYDEWRPAADSPFQTWTDAFAPQRQATFLRWGEGQDGPPKFWNLTFPQLPGAPGDGALTLADLVNGLAGWLEAHLRQAHLQILTRYDIAGVGLLRRAARSGEADPDTLARLGTLAGKMRSVLGDLRDGPPVGDTGWLQRGVAAVKTQVRKLLSVTFAVFGLDVEQDLILADLALSLAIGIVRDVLPNGFDSVDDLDFREWLRSNGAGGEALASAFVRAIYDLGFAYPGGDASDPAKGRGAAGAGARFVLELVCGYKDSPLWKMNAGMGDAVFVPFFEVLRARGVRFEFFHRLTKLELTLDGQAIGSIVLQRQADLVSAPYCPLIEVGGLRCWPNEPLWDQLVHGDGLRAEGADFDSLWDNHTTDEITLEAGRDFDIAILAVPPEMSRIVAPDLAARNPRWREMLAHSTSVPTQAFQLWLRPTLQQLGWKFGPSVLSGGVAPYDTWADMSHLLSRESWSGSEPPQSIAYFCGTMAPLDSPPRDPIDDGRKRAEAAAKTWQKDNLAMLWPAAADPGQPPRAGLILSSYYRANLDPSELYVQTLPDTVKYRLASDTPVCRNLYVAGDWTLTRYNGGCVESAFESAMLAARAIGGEPDDIAGH